jgi:hypothetical protein
MGDLLGSLVWGAKNGQCCVINQPLCQFVQLLVLRNSSLIELCKFYVHKNLSLFIVYFCTVLLFCICA